jgi:hypothetical protein
MILHFGCTDGVVRETQHTVCTQRVKMRLWGTLSAYQRQASPQSLRHTLNLTLGWFVSREGRTVVTHFLQLGARIFSRFWPHVHDIWFQLYTKQDILVRTNRLFSLIRQGIHWKWRVQQFFYCCVCIRYRGNISTELRTSNDTGIFTEASRCLATIRGYTYRHTDWWEGFFN